jgi:CubicO group peptidase (beta-lactamase class C family)
METTDTTTIDPAVIDYLRSAPPPRKSVTEADFSNAFINLDLAARLATSRNQTDGSRWVPGLSIVLVRRIGGACRASYYAYGTKHIDKDELKDKDAQISEHTLFPCASLSKPVSASLLAYAALHRHVDPKDPNVKKWDWRAPVPKAGEGGSYSLWNAPRDPRKPNEPPPPPTLRQWLSHLSGLPDHAGDLIEDMNPEMKRHDLIENIIKFQTGIDPDHQNYTNMGFTIGCAGAANMLGIPEWEAFALGGLKALGMTESTYSFVSVYKDSSNRAYPHQGKPDAPDLEKLVTHGWRWHVVPEADERDPHRQAPAGSLLSSANDLGAFLIAHLDKKFGADFPTTELDPKEERYALGWNVADHSKETGFEGAANAISFNHSGAFSLGAGTFLRFDPGVDFGIAILSNGEPTGVPEALGQLFFKTLYGQSLPLNCDHATLMATARCGYMGQMYRQKIENYKSYYAKERLAIPARIGNGEVFLGHSLYFGCDFKIERTTPISPGDSGLYLMMGNDGKGHHAWRFPLHCIVDSPSSSTFIYETKGENEVGLSAIKLTWQGNTIASIEDDWLNSQGKGLGVIERTKK